VLSTPSRAQLGREYTLFAFRLTQWDLEHELQSIAPLIHEVEKEAAVIAKGIYVLSPTRHKQLTENLSTALRRYGRHFVSATVDPDQGAGQVEFFPPEAAERKFDSWN
jgi:hypothetical protein